MRNITGTLAAAAVTLLLVVGPVSPAWAQAPAGQVSRLEGTAAVARATTPQPNALKIKDPLYLRDLVTTGERSRAQLLLGGKAMVTIREQSSMRITEVPAGSSTIDMTDGKLKVVAIKDRLKPGDRIEVRTPTAITAVRGTGWITEVIRRPSGPPITRVTVLDGVVEVTPLDPATGRPRGPVVRLNPLQQLDVDGSTTPGAPIVVTKADADHLDATFAFSLKAGVGTNPDVVKHQLERAASDAAAAQAAGRLPGTSSTGPTLSGDDLRSRSGVTPLPSGSGGRPTCGNSC
jgi:FecR-like protein